MKNYFIIHNSEGDTTVDQVDKEELLKRIAEEYYGEVSFHKALPEETDTNFWGENLLIIKGEVVTPTPVKVIEKFDIE
ncbi:MAG: hypothetical protein GY861_15600 [bacterium]|nr:hypothetical protein [bacterium]